MKEAPRIRVEQPSLPEIMLRLGFNSEHIDDEQGPLSLNSEHPEANWEHQQVDWEQNRSDSEHLRGRMSPIDLKMLRNSEHRALGQAKMLQQFTGLQHPPDFERLEKVVSELIQRRYRWMSSEPWKIPRIST